LIIYLSDLSHTGQGRNPNHVPLASGYLACAAKEAFLDLDITIFRDPHLFLQAIKIQKPDIVGFSVYTWSECLSSFMADKVKKTYPDVITVAGGPSVDDIDEEITHFIKTFPYYDVVVPNEGEVGFNHLIGHVRTHNRLILDDTITGCVRLASDGSLLRGEYIRPDLDKLPSPYLEGWMAPFLKDGYLPILQTMRGCPYSCTYCCSGSKQWSKLRAFDLDRVKAEFDYIRENQKSIEGYLFLTDENLGVLKERDVKLAQYIRDSYDKRNYPAMIDTYTDKRVTEYTKKINDILRPIKFYNMSFQTLNEDARKAVKRININHDDIPEFLEWVKEKKISSTTEMIFGFPNETLESYISGLEWLQKNGFDKVHSYELRLLRGSDLFTIQNREKYNIKTKYRLGDRSFGVYDKVVVADVEEVAISANTYNLHDYIKVRKYGFFFFLVNTKQYFSGLTEMMLKIGVPGEKLITYLANYNYGNKLMLNTIVKEYGKRVQEELFESLEECTESIAKRLHEGEQVPAGKMNLIFLGKVVFNQQALKELTEVIKEFIYDCSNDRREHDLFDDYIDNVLLKQIVDFSKPQEYVVSTQTRVDVEAIKKNKYDSVDGLLGKSKVSCQLLLHDQARRIQERKKLIDINDEVEVQEFFLLSPSRWLKRILV